MANRVDMYVTALVVLSIGVLTINFAHGIPVASRSNAIEYDPEEAAGMVEGDMMLTDEQILFLHSPIRGRNGLIAETKRWPNRLVYYKIIGNFDAAHRNAILSGIRTLEARTCLRFQEADATQKAYVAIDSQIGGCYTAVGYLGKVQTMNLEVYPIGEGCFRPGTILHEFMHALGFYHQQSASDRDNYIDVLYDNIVDGKEFNFKRYTDDVITDFDVGYDYDSCLHYRPGAFSKNGEDTIVPKDSTATIGQRLGLSKKDIDKINIMYKCPIEI
ncbi:seminal metalloprotease 1-like [Teleopsis dalmanni]|uniref:seminal metalloprotease 1-like n=1 Tax=Teleopsis dalmanni TaxID=139649 RepID=UPI0018CF10D5|nr:seminal metalloprotease 1-like [Teleopsis dalmanni]